MIVDVGLSESQMMVELVDTQQGYRLSSCLATSSYFESRRVRDSTISSNVTEN